MTFLKKGNGTREVAAEPGAMMKVTGRIGVDMIPVMRFPWRLSSVT